jgi:DNA-binding NarL/FixJ family response regulator
MWHVAGNPALVLKTNPRDGDALLVLENLPFAILLVAPGRDHVRLANAAGRDVLKQFRATFRKPPRELLDVIESPSTEVRRCTSPTGLSYYVRARALPAEQGVLVLVNDATRGDADLSQLLASRFGLNHRDRRIALLVHAGLSNADIATEMALQVSSVKHYLSAIFQSLGVKSRTQLMALIQRLGV